MFLTVWRRMYLLIVEIRKIEMKLLKLLKLRLFWNKAEKPACSGVSDWAESLGEDIRRLRVAWDMLKVDVAAFVLLFNVQELDIKVFCAVGLYVVLDVGYRWGAVSEEHRWSRELCEWQCR